MVERIAARRLLVHDPDRRKKGGHIVEKWAVIPEHLLPYVSVDDPTRVVPLAPEGDYEDFDDGTVAKVLAWVGNDPDRARYALSQELARETSRAGVISALTSSEFTADPDDPDDDDGSIES